MSQQEQDTVMSWPSLPGEVNCEEANREINKTVSENNKDGETAQYSDVMGNGWSNGATLCGVSAQASLRGPWGGDLKDVKDMLNWGGRASEAQGTADAMTLSQPQPGVFVKAKAAHFPGTWEEDGQGRLERLAWVGNLV